jgi:hypothetical protein
MFRQTCSIEVRQAAGCSGRHAVHAKPERQAFIIRRVDADNHEKSRETNTKVQHSFNCVTFVTEFIFLLGLLRRKLLASSATWDVSLN